MFNVSHQYSLPNGCVSLAMYCSTNLTHSRWFSTYMQVIELSPKKQIKTMTTILIPLQNEMMQVLTNETNQNKRSMVNTKQD